MTDAMTINPCLNLSSSFLVSNVFVGLWWVNFAHCFERISSLWLIWLFPVVSPRLSYQFNCLWSWLFPLHLVLCLTFVLFISSFESCTYLSKSTHSLLNQPWHLFTILTENPIEAVGPLTIYAYISIILVGHFWNPDLSKFFCFFFFFVFLVKFPSFVLNPTYRHVSIFEVASG